MSRLLYILASFLIIYSLQAQVNNGQSINNFFKASGTPVDPKVPVSWNRYHTNEGLEKIYHQMIEAYPNLVKLESIGQSYGGRQLWLLTITNQYNKPHTQKPAFWIDGNIHANEIQTAEAALYTAWYLAETYGSNDFITELIDNKVFYILPVMNPDGRDYFMTQPNTTNSPRSGTMPLDDDGDGKVGEDGHDDLDGNGHITMMRRKNTYGQWTTDPTDPRRMVRAATGTFGEWDLLGWEGYDRDGDGQINEDPDVGYYDHNRDWGWNWQPDYVQRGAFHYPFSLPESRAVRDFAMAHPNIAGVQTHHNTGGMFLRGPGAEADLKYYLDDDISVYDVLGQTGEQILPGYRYLIGYRDLYTVLGGQRDWFHLMRGAFTFTTEMFTRYFLFHEPNLQRRGMFPEDLFLFDRYLLFEDAFVPWNDFSHPQYGDIQIGGFKKNYVRINPGFMLEQELHRLMAFSLYHASQTPNLSIDDITVTPLGNGLHEVTAVVLNNRLIPTHSGANQQFKIDRPNLISIEGAEVLAGMLVHSRDLNVVTEQRHNPSSLQVANIPGMGTVIIRWIVTDFNTARITIESEKGGVISKEISASP